MVCFKCITVNTLRNDDDDDDDNDNNNNNNKYLLIANRNFVIPLRNTIGEVNT
jgi:hypothetical protein